MSTPDSPPRPPGPAGLRVVALVLALVTTASLLAWPLGLFVSLFLFDAPGSENNRLLVALAWAIWTYGGTAFVGAVTAFICWWRRFDRVAAIAGAVPLVHAVAVVGLFVALQVLCGGQTRC